MGRVHVEFLSQQVKLFRRGRFGPVLAVRGFGIVVVVYGADIHRRFWVDQRRHGFMQLVMPKIHDGLLGTGFEQRRQTAGQIGDLHLAQADAVR